MSTFTFAAGDWFWVALFWRATQKENPINPAWPAEAIQAKAAKSCQKKQYPPSETAFILLFCQNK